MATIDEQRVLDLCEALLAELPPDRTEPEEFLGRQFDMGLAWAHFPEGYGGLGLTPQLHSVVFSRLADAGAPNPFNVNGIGYGMSAPTIVAHGSEAQKRRYLRPLFTGEEVWCQLFSEPGAGSDLAGLATRAERDGDEWVINGQKIWTTRAHVARWGTLVARTDPDQPKHKGLSFFVIDMQQPGVQVKPLFQMTGEGEFNEVFLTDARVPDSERVGEVGDGWRVSITTLMNERAVLGSHETARGSGPIADAVETWAARGGGTDAERDELAQLWVEAEVFRLTTARAIAARASGIPGPEGSLGKLLTADLNKRISNFTMDLLGAEGMLKPDGYPMTRTLEVDRPSAQHAFLRARANSIEGGTSEIAKNILAERILGLPGDVRVDREVAWRDVPRS